MYKQQTNTRRRDPHRVPNDKTTPTLEAMLTAANAIGRDGKGGGRLVGYFQALAVKEPKMFVALLGRLLACEEPQVNEQKDIIIQITPDEAKV
jgi:hypothetical protein